MYWYLNGKKANSLTFPFITTGAPGQEIAAILINDSLQDTAEKVYLCVLDADHVGFVLCKVEGRRLWKELGGVQDSSCFVGTLAPNSFLPLTFKLLFPVDSSEGMKEIQVLACHGDGYVAQDTFCGGDDTDAPLWGDDEAEVSLWSVGTEGCPDFDTGSICGGKEYGSAIPGEDLPKGSVVYLDPTDRKLYVATNDALDKEATVIGIMAEEGIDLLELGGQARTTDGDVIYEHGGEEVDSEGVFLGVFYDVVRKFDPVARTWSELGSCAGDRRDHIMVLYENALYIWGGRSPEDGLIDTLFRFDLNTFVCTELTAGGTPRLNANAIVYGDEIHITGGASATGAPVLSTSIYLISSDEWIEIPYEPPDPPDPPPPIDPPPDDPLPPAPVIYEPPDWISRKSISGYTIGQGAHFEWSGDPIFAQSGNFHLVSPNPSQVYIAYYDMFLDKWTVLDNRNLYTDGISVTDLITCAYGQWGTEDYEYHSTLLLFPKDGGAVMKYVFDLYAPTNEGLGVWSNEGSINLAEIDISVISHVFMSDVQINGQQWAILYGNYMLVDEGFLAWIGAWPVQGGGLALSYKAGESSESVALPAAGVLVGNQLYVWRSHTENGVWTLDIQADDVHMGEPGPVNWSYGYGPNADYWAHALGYLNGSFYFCFHKTTSLETEQIWVFDPVLDSWSEGKAAALLNMDNGIVTVSNARFYYVGGQSGVVQHKSLKWIGSTFTPTKKDIDNRGQLTELVWRYYRNPKTVSWTQVGAGGTKVCWYYDYSSLSWIWGWDALMWDAGQRKWRFRSEYNIQYRVGASTQCRVDPYNPRQPGLPWNFCGTFLQTVGVSYTRNSVTVWTYTSPVLCSPYAPYMYRFLPSGEIQRIPLDRTRFVHRGFVENEAWSFEPGKILYLGLDGGLTTSRPISGRIVVCGVAITSSLICFDPLPIKEILESGTTTTSV